MESSTLDLVYPIKARKNSDYYELRFSLRSAIKNLPHGNVVLIGGKPRWARFIRHIPFKDRLDPQLSVISKLYEVSKNPEISERFILMNDDFFILEPVSSLRYYYTDSLNRFINRQIAKGDSKYSRSGLYTRKIIGNIEDTKNFSLHVPFVYEKMKLQRLIEKYGVRAYHLRTLYGNEYQIQGTKMKDVKVKDRAALRRFENGKFMSCTDKFAKTSTFRNWIEERFPERSSYEA